MRFDFTEIGNVMLTASVLGLECYFPLFLALLPRPMPSAAVVPGRPPMQCPPTLPAPSALGPAATCGNAGHTGGEGTATTARVTWIILHTLPAAPPSPPSPQHSPTPVLPISTHSSTARTSRPCSATALLMGCHFPPSCHYQGVTYPSEPLLPYV